MNSAIGQYEILELVGTGGQGQVYRARDTKAGRTVAVRVLDGEWPDPLDRTRIINAIRPFTAIFHPNVAALFDVGHQDGRIYLVYEFVPGEKISAFCAGHPMNTRRALDLAAQVADALAEAHAAGFVHGAMTPASVVVTTKGRAKLLDFGLSAWQRDEAADVGPGSDVAALGVLLYQMLTGRPPGAEWIAPSVLNTRLTLDVDRIAMKAVAADPAGGYQSAAEMAADLRSAGERQHALEAALEYRPHTPPRRSRWLRLAVFGALSCAAVLLALWHWQEPLAQAWRQRFGPSTVPTIAVMPFSIGGGDTTRPYFGAALAEDAARRIGEIPGVTVMARGSIRMLAGRQVREAAQAAHADAVLTGSVTPADPEWRRVAIGLALVDGRTGATLVAHDYETALTDIVATEFRAAQDLADHLKIPFTPSGSQRRSSLRVVDAQAYDLYLQARDALAAQDASRAVQLFESAIAADASLIEARTGLVEALYSGATFEGRMSLAEAFPRMRAVADEAVAIEPESAAVQMAFGLAAATVRDALTRLGAAIAADRSSPGAYLAMAGLLREIDPARAVRLQQRAIDLDPLLPAAHLQLAATYVAMGQFDQALLEGARGQALQPTWPWWDTLRVRVRLARPSGPAADVPSGSRPAVDAPPRVILQAAELIAARKYAAAVTMLEGMTRLYPAACDAWVTLAGARSLSGERVEAGRIANALLSQAEAAEDPAPWSRCAASMAAAVGDSQRAAQWIRRAAATDESLRLWVAANSLIQPTAAIRQKIYPWRNVADSADVVAAMAALDAAITRTRGDAARLLSGMFGSVQ